MKIKKFEAQSFREALIRVKKELGQEAVILSSEEIGGLKPMVEVVAAIDQDLEGDKFKSISSERESDLEWGKPALPDKVTLSSYAPGTESKVFPAYHDQILREIQNLRENLEELRKKGYEVSLPSSKKGIYQHLRSRCIREDLALQLTEKAEDIPDLSRIIRDDLQTEWIWSEKKVVLLIGSTGVGKTTTAAKLCGQAIKQKRRVGLISLDTFRIGAIEQIRIYSRILGVPLIVASSPEEIRTGVDKLKDRDLILIDTTGRNPKDQSYEQELKSVYALGIPLETHLLISGSSSEHFMTESLFHYRKLPVDRIAFTKMDEACSFGPVYNFLMQAKKPMVYVTTGQRVPNDIEFYSEAQLADLILSPPSQTETGEINPIH